MKLSDYGKQISRPGELSQIIIDVQQAQKKNPDNVIDLSSGDPKVFPELAKVWDECAKKVANENNLGALLAKYGEVFGNTKLLNAVIHMLEPQGLHLKPQNIMFTAGSLSSIFYILNTFGGKCSEKELNVLLPQCPEYSAYSVKGLSIKNFVTLKPNIEIIGDHEFRYRVNLADIQFQNIGAVMLTRPNNPSGFIMSNNDLQSLIDRAAEYDVPVIIDAVYASPIPDLIYEKNIKMIYRKNVIYLMSFSKAGFAGGRLGITIADEELLKPLRIFQINMCITTDSFSQMLAAQALANNQLRSVLSSIVHEYYLKRLQLVKELFKKYFHPKIPYYLHLQQGGIFQWVWFKNLPITDQKLYEILKTENVFIAPGHIFFFAMNDSNWSHRHECIRISLNEPEDRFERGIKKLSEIVNPLYAH